jgi:hypothetical protein
MTIATDRRTNYTWDVFLSYTSGPGIVRDWVDNHFLPRLTSWLAQELPQEPRVFVDREGIQTGDYWRKVLLNELKHSKCLVAVWCLPYFRSEWCVAEWKTMLRRAKASRLEEHGLVYPVSFADGESFPRDARATQCTKLNDWNIPHASFINTPAYVSFEIEMQKVAKGLAGLILNAPAWRPDFPVVHPNRKLLPKIPDPRSMPVPRF